MSEHASVTLQQIENYRFDNHFAEGGHQLQTDEPAPLGSDSGPSPSQLLAAAVANCLSASLLFAMRKFWNNPGPLVSRVTVHMVRNEDKRLRVGHMEVVIQIGSPVACLEQIEKVLASFEDFCVVTQSVRSGFPVAVTVRDMDGRVLKS